MFGILVFQQIYWNLGEECRNKVLGNIFGIDNVSVSGIFIREEEVIFRLFSEGVFYQYFFKLGSGRGSLFCSDKIVNRIIFVDSYNKERKDDFIYLLIELFYCQNEYQVYQILKLFL